MSSCTSPRKSIYFLPETTPAEDEIIADLTATLEAGFKRAANTAIETDETEWHTNPVEPCTGDGCGRCWAADYIGKMLDRMTIYGVKP